MLTDGVMKVNDRSDFYFLTVNKMHWHSPVENLTINRVALWEVKTNLWFACFWGVWVCSFCSSNVDLKL